MWAPWRGAYIAAPKTPGCIFCNARDAAEDGARAHLRLASRPAVVMLNRFPYSSVHLMVAPRLHSADFIALPGEILQDVMCAVQETTQILNDIYRPDGFNIGINLGVAAGAGIADHMHWHVVPRWNGDTNFMPILAGARVMPEHLEQTWDKLRPLFAEFEARSQAAD